MPDAPTKSRRRWLRFSLRSLLIFIAVVGILLGIEKARVLREDQASTTIRELGGNVFLGYRFDSSGKPKEFSHRTVPAWITRTIGEDCFVTVVTVNFDNDFGNRPVDRSKAHGSRVTNESLAVLHAVPEVTALCLAGNYQLTDEGLVHAAGLRHLQVLTLNQTNVRGPGLFHIRSLKSLRGLALHDTPMTDEGLRHLKDLRQLEWLLLDDTAITDNGLLNLVSLKSLRHLSLSNTRITDQGLEHLRGLTGLTWLSLAKTAVTNEGYAELKHSLPKCKIFPP